MGTLTAMAQPFPAAGSQLVDAIARVLAERGPMSEVQLVSALSERGVALGDDPEDALFVALDDGGGLLTYLADGRWAALRALLAGRVFAHRLTGPEVEHDFLEVLPDLSAIDALVERPEYQRLADGSPVAGVHPLDDVDTLAGRGIPLEAIGDLGALLLPPGEFRERELGEVD